MDIKTEESDAFYLNEGDKAHEVLDTIVADNITQNPSAPSWSDQIEYVDVSRMVDNNSNAFFEKKQINIVNEVYNKNISTAFNKNKEKINECNKGPIQSLGFFSEIMKAEKTNEETDPIEPTWEENALNNIDNIPDDIDIKINYLDIKIEETSYLNGCDEKQDESNESYSTRYVQNLEQIMKDVTDNNLNNYEHQSNSNSENTKVKCSLLDTQSSGHLTHEFSLTEKTYKVDVCNKELTASSDLKKLKLIRADKKSHRCDVCNKTFKYLSNIVGHKLTHTGEKPYKCDVCNKGFTHSGNLTQHKLTHTGEKPFKCTVCNKGFTTSSHLKTHTLTHTGEKPYKCDMCNQGFTTSGHLTTHKLSHTGEKPYKCDVCNKRFKSSSCLASHKLSHTSEKPHKCDLCNRTFKKLRSLRNHKLVHVNEKSLIITHINF